MNQLIGVLIVAFMLAACTSPKTESTVDSTGVTEVAAGIPKDTVASNVTEGTDSYMQLKSYLVSEEGISPDQIQVVDSTCAIEIWPTEEQMKKLKDESEEDEFYTVTDDASFYASEARSRLDSFHIKVVDTENKRYLKLKGAKASWLLDLGRDSSPLWGLVFFNVNKEPEIADEVSVATDPEAIGKLRQYFDLK